MSNMNKEHLFAVCVRCMTYNHSSFIKDAMNGFVNQKTSFPYVCCIVDDASTDATTDVINRYMTGFFDLDDPSVVITEETEDYRFCYAQHKENRHCFFAVFFLKYNHFTIKKSKLTYISKWLQSAEYSAECEGDDYWVCESKLQKQVDYLEENLNCGMVYTAYRLQNDLSRLSLDVYTNPRIRHDDSFKWKLLEQKVMIGTCTVLLRTDFWLQLRDITEDYTGFIMGDTQTWFNAARVSIIGYLPEVTAVYRKQPSGATATFDAKRRGIFIQSCLDLHLHLAYKYGAPKRTIRRIKSRFGFSCFNLFFRTKDYDKARYLNKDYFHNNFFINAIIHTSDKFQITHFHGLGTILRTATAMGIISLK